jgi:hypothetical protein
METIDPFANESETLQIDDLTIENRKDRVTIYGSIDITRDKKGLGAASLLEYLFKAIVARLAQEDLPDSLPPPQNIEVVKNPFA